MRGAAEHDYKYIEHYTETINFRFSYCTEVHENVELKEISISVQIIDNSMIVELEQNREYSKKGHWSGQSGCKAFKRKWEGI